MGSACRVAGVERAVAFVAAASAVGCAVAVPAAAQQRPVASGEIDAGSMERALAQLAAQADEQILFDPAVVRGRRAPRIARGTPLLPALDRLLAGSDLTAKRVGPGVIVIQRRADEPTRVVEPPPADIIVTALRRPTLLSETGISLSVVPASVVAALRLTDQRSLSRALPELVTTATGPLQQRLSVRGVSGTGEGTVGVYVGETPVSAPSGTGADPGAMAPDIDLVDVERVELLKGPQGTLYGASSMGGTLRTIFRAPDTATFGGEVSAEGALTAGGAPGAAFSAIVNVPLATDRLAMRAVIARRRVGGVIDNARLGYRDGDTLTRGSERLSLAWTPRTDVQVDAMLLTQRQRADDAGVWFGEDGRYRADSAVRPRSSGDLRLGSATVRWAPTGLRVTATASWYRWQTVRELDFTSVLERQRDNLAACRRVTAAHGGDGCDRPAFDAYLDSRLPSLLHQPMRVRSASGEVRVANSGTGAWRWTVGAFAEHRVDAVDSYTVRADPASGAAIQPFDLTGLRLLDSRLDQQAFFAEVEYDVGHGLTAIAGARLYRYVRGGGGSVPVPNLLTGTGAIGSAAYRSAENGSNIKAALTWRAAPGVIARGVISEGFRPGGVNITPELSAGERVYRADHLWNYEVGVNMPRVGVELAAFHMDWDDTIFAANSVNGAFLYNTNLASVDIDGVEARVSRNAGPLRVAGALSWLDARLAEDTLLGTSDGTGRRGDRLPNVPQVAYALSADLRLSAMRRSVVIGMAASGSGATRSTFNGDSSYAERTPPRSTLDTYVIVADRNWTARLGIDNVFDAVAARRVLSSAFGERQVYSLRPRTVTLTLTTIW